MKKMYLLLSLALFGAESVQAGGSCPETARACAEIVYKEIINSLDDGILEVSEVLAIINNVSFCADCGYSKQAILMEVFGMAVEKNAPEIACKVQEALLYLAKGVLEKYPYLTTVSSLVMGAVLSALFSQFQGGLAVPFLTTSTV